jgi:hypothetical protein
MAIASLSAGVAPAAPFDARYVGGDAKFVFFVDMDAERETAIGQAFLAHLRDDPGYAEFEKDLTEWTGFTPTSDITDITVYGESFSVDDAVIVVRANFDAATLRSILVLLPGSRTGMYADHEILSWNDERTGKRVFLTTYDARTMVMCNDEARLARAIDMLIDPSKSLEPVKTFPRPDPPDEKAVGAKNPRLADAARGWVFVAAVGVGAAPAAAGNAVLSQADVLTIKVAEVDGKTVVTANSTTKKARDIEELFNFANGLKAIGSLAGWTNSNAVPAAAAGIIGELARTTQLTRDAVGVTATLAVANDRAVALLDKAFELHDHK